MIRMLGGRVARCICQTSCMVGSSPWIDYHPIFRVFNNLLNVIGTAAHPSTKSLVDRILGERGFWGWLVKP